MARWKYVEVEIDLNEFDSEDLAEELESRGYTVISGGENPPLDDEIELRSMYETMKLGRDVNPQLVKYLCDKLGVVL
jgi:monomeric isocitrate dehydrogenase